MFSASSGKRNHLAYHGLAGIVASLETILRQVEPLALSTWPYRRSERTFLCRQRHAVPSPSSFVARAARSKPVENDSSRAGQKGVELSEVEMSACVSVVLQSIAVCDGTNVQLLTSERLAIN